MLSKNLAAESLCASEAVPSSRRGRPTIKVVFWRGGRKAEGWDQNLSLLRWPRPRAGSGPCCWSCPWCWSSPRCWSCPLCWSCPWCWRAAPSTGSHGGTQCPGFKSRFQGFKTTFYLIHAVNHFFPLECKYLHKSYRYTLCQTISYRMIALSTIASSKCIFEYLHICCSMCLHLNKCVVSRTCFGHSDHVWSRPTFVSPHFFLPYYKVAATKSVWHSYLQVLGSPGTSLIDHISGKCWIQVSFQPSCGTKRRINIIKIHLLSTFWNLS